MSCNVHLGGHLHGHAKCVSIPIGFSNELQPLPPPLPPPPYQVSIPIGFSNELQPKTTLIGIDVHSFNPYRVFQ